MSANYSRRPPSPFRERYLTLVAGLTYEERVRRLESQPDLLAALDALVEPAYPDGMCHKGICSEENCGRCGRHARARAAIAKATGDLT